MPNDNRLHTEFNKLKTLHSPLPAPSSQLLAPCSSPHAPRSTPHAPRSSLLFLCHRIPYPPNKGDKIRSFNEIKYLSKNHRIDLACLSDDPTHLKYENNLKSYCRRVHIEPLNKMMAKIKGIISLLSGESISIGYFYNTKMQRVVDQWLLENAYNAIICFSSPMAEYIFRSKLPAPRTPLPAPSSLLPAPSSPLPTPRSPLLMDFCDMDSDKWRQYGEASKFPLNKLYTTEFQRLLVYEKKINRIFDHSVFVSEKEADLYQSLAPEARNISVIPNGVDTDFFSPNAAASSPLPAPRSTLQAPRSTLLFTGAMDYQANIDGVTWFSREIFPPLRNRFPHLSFIIVGSNPTSRVKALSHENGIQVTGFVEDIRPYYAAADVCVIPLRMARGVQNKVLEAMAMGKAIVTTSAAIQGITATNGNHLLVADTPEDFIKVVTSLLTNTDHRRQLGAAARAFVTHQYSWNTNMEQLNELITA